MAQIGWIDFNKADRNRARQLLSLIRPEGQLDELGVGSVRDALANQLFPGISTIQTRAKYFFIIPNILRDYQSLSPARKRNTTPAVFLREEQHRVKNTLKEKYNSQEGLGIIGVTLRPRQYIKRNPSDIYWNGLQVYGFMNRKGLSQEHFLRNLSQSNILERTLTEDGGDDADIHHDQALDIHSPVNSSWFQELDINLNAEESDYFKTQIKEYASATPFSLLPLLLKNDLLLHHFTEAENFQEFVQRSLDIDLDLGIRQLLILAHDFAELMDGVHLLYNHLLQQHFFPDDYTGGFEQQWVEWRQDLKINMIDWQRFNPSALLPHIKYPSGITQSFIEEIWRLTFSSQNDLPTKAMITRVKRREQESKGSKSRLNSPASANMDVKLENRIGLSLFQYRFYNARTIIKDIINPV